jgi:predicted DCC family thiol-disulfide oxidoreductase YuxK
MAGLPHGLSHDVAGRAWQNGGMAKVRELSQDELRAAAQKAPGIGERDMLIFDGDCRFCQAQAARLLRWSGERLGKLPLQTPELLPALGIEHEAAMSALHLVTSEGVIYRGMEAAVQALRHRSILGRLAKLYYVPVCRQLADLAYRLIARYRYAIMGRAIARGECDGACAVHLPRPPK